MRADNYFFTTPVGRIVQGSLYKGTTVNYITKEPLTYKKGARKGEIRTEYYFALAIKKGNEQHWGTTKWGAVLWAYVHAEFNNKVPAKFVWKVDDGDDTTPEGAHEIKNCDREGFAGHWILRLKSDRPCNIINSKHEQITQEDFINPGDYVQVYVEMGLNKDEQIKSVFLNPVTLMFNSYGERIRAGVKDSRDCGFDENAAPVGTAVPVENNFNTPAAEPKHSDNHVAKTPPPLPPGATPPATTYVEPHKEILQGGATEPPAPPAPPTAAPTVKTRVMTAKAAGAKYEQFIERGWTDELLIEKEYMLP